MEKSSKCAVYDHSICVACVNRSLNEYKVTLDSLKSRREISYLRLRGLLIRKDNEISQHCWMDLQNEKLC
ncbi:hypothetical protein V5N11_004276 [Cardamine amara subsp. amara]|uniref:Uncharacterized protein n=1 Tax=Cardamine amara subsp. amara TaxID=228776 RepID=A0ABD1B6E4_CARAN